MLEGLRGYLPKNEDDLYVWIMALMAAYILAAYVLAYLLSAPAKDPGLSIIERVYNAATFALSFMLLLGIADADVLKAIGTVKPFLLFGGFAGIVYSCRALFKP